MEIAEILSRIERTTGRFERAAVEAAVQSREEITPELLRILEDTVNRAAELAAEEDYMAHLYAIFLLAQFREHRAYPLMIRFVSLPGALLRSLCGDFITQDLDHVMASVCGSDIGDIQSAIENDEIDEWVRGALVASLVSMVASGQQTREEILEYFARLYRGGLRRNPSNVWNELAACSADLCPSQLIDDIEQAYREGLVDPGFVGLGEIKRDIRGGKDRALACLADSPHRRLVEDTVKEMESWACFDENAGKGPNLNSVKPIAVAQVRRTEPRIGRNDPCPCGSGKKYKKCCGA